MWDLSAVTGIIGAITGPIGSVLGFLAYRRSQKLKALDLRLELRKAEGDLRHIVSGLPELLKEAKHSRTNVRAAMGTLLTGAEERWKNQWQTDRERVAELQGKLPAPDQTYANSKPRELESLLVNVHNLKTEATGLREKYLGELASDDRDRDHIKADIRSRRDR